MTDDPAASIDELSTLRRAAIDTSSIICMHAARRFAADRSEDETPTMLELVAGAIRLVTTRAVSDELRRGSSPIELPASVAIIESVPTTTRVGSQTDTEILAVAARRHCALITEDRRLIIAAEDDGVQTANAAWLLEMLLLRQIIDVDEHARLRDQLQDTARYSRWVRGAAEALHWEVRKSIGK